MLKRTFPVSLLLLSLWAISCRELAPRNTTGPVDEIEMGAELYAKHCTVCHGSRGQGDGPGAAYLFPPARDFTTGLFHWVSTVSTVPSHGDILRTLRRGVPGSAMPSWTWLGENELEALSDHVLFLTRDALAQQIAEGADDALVPMGWEEAAAGARESFEAGAPLPRLDEPELSPELLARGAEVYADACAMCHGPDGSGQREPAWNLDGTPNWARDFTAGFVASGADFASLANRVRAGIPGTAMLPTVMSNADLGALVAHVRSMIPPGSEERYVHHRGRLEAPRIEQLPVRFDDPRWRAAEPLEVTLAPLRWKEGGVFEVSLRALHDGSALVVRARWEDKGADVALFSDVHKPDAFALQFSADPRPALFGMGAASHPTTIWHWKSVRLEEVAGALDLLSPTPHLIAGRELGEVKVDVPLYHPLLATPEISERVDTFRPRGVDQASSARRQASSEIEVSAHHADGAWTVVFRRPLRLEGQLNFDVDEVLQVACAAWNGSIGNHGPDKAISIWQELVLLP